MILENNVLDEVYNINESCLREALQREARSINEHTDTHMEVYNSRPNHFTIVADDVLEYVLDTTDYTAELTDLTAGGILLVAVADDRDDFEERLAINVISAVYKTL